jgi:DNA-binding transcriptional ArsR family regulator
MIAIMSTIAQPYDVFSAISDPVRRRILDMLREGEKAVTELLAPFKISQPAVSKHLRILREAGLIRARQNGRKRIYALRAERLKRVDDWVAQYEVFWDEKLINLGRYLHKKHT